MRLTVAWACLAGLVTIAWPAQALTCDNHGAVIAVGYDNAYVCDADGDDCANHGVVILVGWNNRYECGGPCVDHGVVVSTWSEYCGRQGTFVCLRELCADPCNETPARAIQDQRPDQAVESGPSHCNVSA